jgi:pimeloyl-ACP methyl ester carboxylesterase
MFFPFKGGRIHYSDSGKRRVILLLHGYLEEVEVWNGFSEKLASAFRVITVDLPGCGLSDFYGRRQTGRFLIYSENQSRI